MRYIKLLCLALAMLFICGAVASCNDEAKGDEVTTAEVFYTVRFATVGGTPVDDVTVKAGERVPKPKTPEKAGYVFGGWKNSDGKWFFDIDKVESDMTLNAIWVDEKTVFEYSLDNEKATITKYIGNVSELIIPKTLGGFPVEAIGERAFYETSTSSTSVIVIGEHIKSVGKSAFYNSVDIEIVVEAKLTDIGEQAFYGCTGLSTITLGEGVTEIPYEAFSGCSRLTGVTLSSTVENISENAFELCTSLKSLTAHNSLKKIEDSAFESCTAFVAVYYYGSDEEWENTEIAEGNNGNEVILNAKFYRYSETEPADNDGKYWHFDNNEKVRIW